MKSLNYLLGVESKYLGVLISVFSEGFGVQMITRQPDRYNPYGDSDLHMGHSTVFDLAWT